VEQDLAMSSQLQQRIKAFTLNEIKKNQDIKKNGTRNRHFTARRLKELPKERLVKLIYIFNAILRLEYWPTALMRAEIIMITKTGKYLIDLLP